MRPLNQTERNSLILKFVLLFVVAVSIVAIVIYFNFGTYKKIGEQQVVKLNAYTNYVKNEKRILHLMDTLNKQIDVYGNSTESPRIVMDKILRQLRFSEFANSDTSSIKLLKALDVVYAKLLDLKDKSVSCSLELKEAEKEYNKLQSDHLDEIKRMEELHVIELQKASLPK